jgi:hypothetical protein
MGVSGKGILNKAKVHQDVGQEFANVMNTVRTSSMAL